MEQHEALLAAVEKGDPPRAERAMKDHLLYLRDVLRMVERTAGERPEVSYVVDAVRTPDRAATAARSPGVRPDDLAARVVRALVERSPGLDPARIDDVLFGNANGAGEENRDVARMAALLAGLPIEVPGATVNRLCGSGMEAAIAGQPRDRWSGDASICIAGGVESMSRAPWVVHEARAGLRSAPTRRWSPPRSAGGWSTPRCPTEWTVSLGEGAEILAASYEISARRRTSSPLESHRRAAAAWERGAYDDETVDVAGVELERDEPIRPDTLAREAGEAQARLPRRTARVTAGNSSPLNDGAAALLLADEAGVEAIGREPLARIVSRGLHAVDPPHLRDRARGGGQPGARAGRDRLGRPRGGGAQRGLRRPGAGLRVRVAASSTPRSPT